MTGLGHLWAGWRASYIGSTDPPGEGCVLCRVLGAGDDAEVPQVVRPGRLNAAILNAYPYTSGHLMVLPLRHVGELEDLDPEEASELWRMVGHGVRAVKAAYRPDGVNVGANLGVGSGAGVPGHLHVHVLPRWTGDTNFMTAVAETRVLPETLTTTHGKLQEAWPEDE